MQSAATTEPPSQPHILVVDDDAGVATLVARYLTGHGCRVSIAGNGAQLRSLLAGPVIDLILLDLTLPDEDGLVLLTFLQQRWRGPVIVVSGRGDAIERVVGLELGADDYVTKPFEFRELLARIHSVLRRTRREIEAAPAPGGREFRFDGLRLEAAARRLIDREGHDVPLTAGEFALLQVMLERPDRVLTRDDLMNCMHGRDAGPFDRAIDVNIGRLRRKIEIDAANPRVIKSVRGVGYVLASQVEQH